MSRLAKSLAASLAFSLVLGVGVAQAQRHDVHVESHARYEHIDPRFGHNHYYPGRGYAVGVLPRERIVVNGGGGRFYYSGGVWYRPYGPRFVVVAPPLGLFVPVLPPFYTTVWFGGNPYYYANDTYYSWRPATGQYEVVAPPDGSGDSGSTDAPAQAGAPGANGDVFIYPKNGQNDDQQAKDRYECHRWAQGQSGFDPTQSSGGVPADQAGAKRADYNRALTACLEGRGYSVK